MPKNGKEKIIEVAFELFLQKGYQKTSLADIIKKSALSKGAIYHHFSSKQKIYEATLELFFFNLFQNLQINDTVESLQKRIENRFSFYVNLINFVENTGDGIDFPIRRYYQFQLESEEDPIIRAKIIETLHQYRLEIEHIINNAIAKKEINTTLSSTIIAQQLMAMIEGITIHHSTLEKDSKSFLLQKFDEVILPYISLITNKN